MTEDELEAACLREEKAIETLPEGVEKYRRLVELGEVYVDNDFDNGALRVLSGVMEALSQSSEPETEELFQRACQGLTALRSSDNDYVSDEAGKILSYYIQ